MPNWGFNTNAERYVHKGMVGSLMIGVIFALSFCPTSGMFYFGMLIPLSVTATGGYVLPVIFAIATSLPVPIVAWILAFSAKKIGDFYGKMQCLQKWLNIVAAVVFILIGIYYCQMMYK